jgi:hypothetical protein
MGGGPAVVGYRRMAPLRRSSDGQALIPLNDSGRSRDPDGAANPEGLIQSLRRRGRAAIAAR